MKSFHSLINPLASAGLGLYLSSVLTGCTPVEAWERGYLAKPQMSLDSRPVADSLTTHVYGSREATAAGNSAKGGGCGCY